MRTPHPLPRRFLSALVAAAIAPAAMAGDPPFVADAGDDILVDAGNYETSGDSESVLVVRQGGKAEADQVGFTTQGKTAYAVSVSGPGSELTLASSTLETHGVGAHGLSLVDTGGPSALLRDVTITTHEGSAAGAHLLGSLTAATFAGGSIATAGYAANGVDALAGAVASLTDTRVATTGERASALVADGDGAGVRADHVTLTTTGGESHGVYVERLAYAVVSNGSSITTTGSRANAVNVNAGSGLVDVSGSTLATKGDVATGVDIYDATIVRVSDTRIETAGKGALGINNRGAFAEIDRVSIETNGASAYGVLAAGTYAGRVPHVQMTNSQIATRGKFGYGAAVSGGAKLALTHSTIQTDGVNAHGLRNEAGDLSVTGTRVTTAGAGAYGALLLKKAKFTMKGGSIESAHAAALGLDDPGLIRIGGDAVLKGGNGAFAEIDRQSTAPFTIVLDDTAHAIGDIRLDPAGDPSLPDGTRANVSIRHGAVWGGATSIVRRVDLENGGTWRVTGDSSVGALRNDNGFVHFTAPPVGDVALLDTVTTLTVTGDYEGRNGLLHMRSYLGDDASTHDLLHVVGNTSGASRITVQSLGGEGDFNREGIRLVRVDGRSDGTFELAGRAVAGANEYFLHKGSVSAPDDGGWYLRSTLPEPIVDPGQGDGDGDDGDVVDPPLPPVATLRPETGTYRANQTAVLDMFQSGPGAGVDDEPDASRGAAWARFERNHTTFDFRDQITTTTATSELTLGSDLWRGGEGAAVHVGVMAGVGRADTRGTSMLTRYSAKGRVRGATLGVYGGARMDSGSYLHGWVRHAHFNERVEGSALPQERYGSGTLAASVEGGHRWRIALGKASEAYLEPQAQVISTRLRGGAHVEANGTRVAPRHASGTTGRLGFRAAARWVTPAGHTASPYVTTNWYRRLGRLDATTFNTASFIGGAPRNAYAVKLGVTFLHQSGWRLWTDAETRFGARNYRRVAGTIGVRRAW